MLVVFEIIVSVLAAFGAVSLLVLIHGGWAELEKKPVCEENKAEKENRGGGA